MTRFNRLNTPPTKQAGIGLMGAVFFMVVVGLLSAAITSSVTNGADAFALEIISQRAFFAAETGAQLGVQSAYPPQGTGSCGNNNWDLNVIDLPQCSATVSCRSSVVGGVAYHTIESTGRCSDGGNIVAERVILVRAQS